MSSTKHGGSAFPHAELIDYSTSTGVPPSTGMTLRDYFAAQALPPMVAQRVTGHISYGNEQDIAKRAYEIADAMLEARAA